jgi:uncharacterized damage-inducible protein DinB
MTADELRQLHAYHRWATERFLEAAERVPAEQFARPPEPGTPSLRDALVRLLWTDWVWLRRFFGLSPRIVFDPEEYRDVAALRARWAEVYDEMADLLGPLGDAGVDRTVAYRDVHGRPDQRSFGRLLLHVVESGTYQRGTIAALLRRLGAPEPSVDLLRFWRDAEASG